MLVASLGENPELLQAETTHKQKGLRVEVCVSVRVCRAACILAGRFNLLISILELMRHKKPLMWVEAGEHAVRKRPESAAVAVL